MTENEKFIFESVVTQVRMGFQDIETIKDNIIEEIEDNEFEHEISEKKAFEWIEDEWKKLITESKSWDSPTNTEMLINAFKELCKLNIIALHNAGYTTSDGEYEVVAIEKILRQNNIISDGYCFYHEQDLSRAIEAINDNPSLYIAYQKVNNSDEAVSAQVAKKIIDILQKNNLEVDWNGNVQTKICLPNFKWQLLYDPKNMDILDYDKVAQSMIK